MKTRNKIKLMDLGFEVKEILNMDLIIDVIISKKLNIFVISILTGFK